MVSFLVVESACTGQVLDLTWVLAFIWILVQDLIDAILSAQSNVATQSNNYQSAKQEANI